MRSPLRATARLSSSDFDQIRTELILNHCKWDPQVGDTSVLAPFSLLMSSAEWPRLANDAESLAAELMSAEQEILSAPELQAEIGIPRKMRGSLLRASAQGARVPRILRFDFHWTTMGWQISEVNADVPGGLCEASALPMLMANHCSGAHPTGNPGARWAEAIAACTEPHGRDIAMLTAPGFMEDHQVMAFLSKQLRDRGFRPHLANPANLLWKDGIPSLNPTFGASSLGAIVRFFQAEWLPRQSRSIPWQNFFLYHSIPILNPASSIAIESKRFPIIWKHLRTPIPTWEKLLPRTSDPRDADWRQDDECLLKSAFCNTGDTVTVRSLMPQQKWRSTSRHIRWNPRGWVAQRKFHTLPVDTPLGEMFPCIGVYTIAGKAAGIYGRISPTPIIDFAAIDVAVLVKELE